MSRYLKQSTAAQTRTIGPFVDDVDFKTAETALTINASDVRLKKNGADDVAKNSGGATHDVNGCYHLTFDATDTDTVGELFYTVKVAGALQVFGSFTVLEEAVYDQLFAASAPGAASASKATQIYSDTTIIASKAVQIYSDTTIVVSDTTAIHSDTTAIHSDSTKIESDAAHIESDAVRIESKAVQIYSDTTITSSKVVQIYSDTTIVYSDTTLIYSDTTLISSDAARCESKAVQIYSDTTITSSKAAQIYSDTAIIYSDTTLISADGPNTPTKGVEFANLMFMMVDSTDLSSPETGVTVTATISKDGGAFAACTNSVSEVSGGWYKITLTSTETNADSIAIKLTGTGCAQRNIAFRTQPT
jgi:hypothetical protein